MEFKYKDIVFNNKLVLNKGCIEFNKGQITIITGESGSGKTTLFRLMTKGNDGWKDLDLYQNVSTCPQEPVFLEGLTIREHIEYIEKLTDCHISLDNYVEKLHLNELMDMYPSQLSGGEQKRVAFLLCMAKDVDIYILDEPTSSLNNAYSKIYCDILNLLIEKGKGIVLFTHDEKLLSIGNIKYHIKDKILNTVSNEKKETEYSLSQHISKNLNKTSPAFFTMRKKQKIYVKILHFMITFSIAMVAFGYSFSRDVLDIHHSYSQKISSNEITVYKSTAQAIHDGVADYTFNHEVPLKDKDIKKIANLDNIETVEWRYDCLEPNYEFNEDIKEVSYDPENAKHDYTISIIKNEQELAQVNIEDNITVSTYIKNHKQSKNIEIDFKNEGVYISRNVADMIKKSINISKDDELKGVYLTFDISVPLYNTHGRWMGITDDEESMYIYSVTVTHESVSLPIAGILNWSSFGLNNTYSNSLYVERDIVENMIEKHKKTEDRKLYVIGVNYDKYYENELPKDFDGEVNRVFEDSVWQPTALSVYVDGSENVYTVAQNLSDMGYYVDNESIDSEAINRGIVSLMNVFYYGSFIISAIIVIYAASILFVQRKQNARINEYFKQLGLSEFDILKIRKHYYLLNVFHEFKKLMLILIVLFGLRSIKIHALFFPNIISIILAIVLHMICHYILPQLFDKLKND